MKHWTGVVGGLVAGVLVSAGGAWAQTNAIASAGGASLTQAEVTGLVKEMDDGSRTRLATDPALLDQVVRARLAVKAALTEAQARGWDKQPQVQAAIKDAQRDVIVRSYLASVSAPPADYPTDADIQTVYDRNHAAFTAPRALRVAQIFIATPAGADAATLDRARKQATDLVRQARAAGADFAALAKASSQDKASAANGGDMGFVPEPLLLPEIRKAAEGVKAGEVAGPIQTAAGFHVIRVIDTRSARLRPLAEVKEQIQAELRQQRAQQNAQAYLAKFVDGASIDEAALKKALAAAQ